MNYSKYSVFVSNQKIFIKDKYLDTRIKLSDFMFDFTVKSYIHNLDIYFSTDNLEILKHISKYFNFDKRSELMNATNAIVFKISKRKKSNCVIWESDDSGIKKGLNQYDNLVFQIDQNFIVIRNDVVDISYQSLENFISSLPLIQKLIEGRINQKFLYNGFLPVHGTAGLLNNKKYIVIGESHSGKTSYFKKGKIFFDEVLYSDGIKLTGYPFVKTYEESNDEVIGSVHRKVVKLSTNKIIYDINTFKLIMANRFYEGTSYLEIEKLDKKHLQLLLTGYLNNVPGKYFFNQEHTVPSNLINNIIYNIAHTTN
ncbi:hypothetical protein EFN45_09220 [Leuconostoc citreum]|uniref:hypothetical protein n=1 Tax=Leuconostoc citreum TaxID=33964 RepID=UPI0021A84655|nr:hypothetical protein [Leuconostoc citreum]MCT3070259.1 hypothetical protein [Leuconostoc citreum]